MTYISNPINGIKSTLNSSNSYVVGGTTTINQVEFASFDSSLTVADGSVFDNNTTIKIDSINGTEYLQITGISVNVLTVTRGAFDTTALDHFTSNSVSGIYIGTEELNGQPDVMVSLKSDVAGTEYFDFSTDGVLWDTFPVTGFSVTANIHEFHTAVKGKRYFRLRFETSSSSKSTSFRANTYYGVFRQGNLPLNQSISDDSDSIVVRSVGVGRQPDGDYVNAPADGSAFSNTSLLTTTHLSENLDSSNTFIFVDSTAGFGTSGASGTLAIEQEQITFTVSNSTAFSNCIRGINGTEVTSHLNNTPVREAFESDWYDTDGWNSIEIFVKSDIPTLDKGIIVEFTDDVQADSVVSRGSKEFTHSNVNVDEGFSSINLEPKLDGFRVRYINGDYSQTDFYINATLKVNSSNLRFNDGLALVTSDFLTDVALEKVSNYSTDVKFGRHTGLTSNNDPQDIFEGGNQATANNFYTGQPVQYIPKLISVVSSSSNDTSAIGPANLIANPFSSTSTNNSVVLVTDTTPHGIAEGDLVTFSGSDSLGGNITANVLNQTYITSNVQSTTYEIIAKDPSTNLPVFSNSSDTGDGGVDVSATYSGTGASKIRIFGLESQTSINYTFEDIELNGTSSVSSLTKWWRVNRAYVTESGSNSKNVGKITITSSDPSIEFVVITAGYGQSQLPIYTVPYKKNIIIKSISISITRNNGSDCSGIIKFLVRDINSNTFRSIRVFNVTNSSRVNYTETGGILIKSGADLKFEITEVSETSTQYVNARIEFVSVNI